MEAYFSGDIPPLKKVETFRYGNCGGTFSVRTYLHSKKSGGIPIWKMLCSFKISLIFQYLHIFPVEAYFSGDIPPLKKVETFRYGNCGGTFSVRTYLHSKKVEAFLYGNCNVALKFH